MSNPKRGFVIYFDNYPMVVTLPPDQRGWLFTALLEYAAALGRGEGVSTEEILVRYPPLAPQTRTAFQFMAASVDRDTQRWFSRRQAAQERRQNQEKERAAAASAQALQQEQAERERLRRALEQVRT